MAKEVHTTTNMYRKPEGRKIGEYFKGKTESCNRAPGADTHAQSSIPDQKTHEREPKG